MRCADNDRQLSRHYFPLIWLLLASFAGFGLFVAWDTGMLWLVYRLDQSHLALVITGVTLIASGHALWHILLYSDYISALAGLLDDDDDPGVGHRRAGPSTTRFIDELLTDLTQLPARAPPATGALALATSSMTDTDSIIEIHADRLRSPVELGWFLVDLAVRLGLVGTIVGFILIFTSLSDTSVSGAEGIRDLLVSMSSGMGTALFTTLTGLIAASLLSVQYLILGREAETLVGLMIRLRNRRSHLPLPAEAPSLTSLPGPPFA